MTFSEDLKTRVVSVYSQGNMTMCEVAKTFNVSLGFVHNVVTCHRWFGQVTNLRAYSDGYSIQSTRYLFEMIEIDPSTYSDKLKR